MLADSSANEFTSTQSGLNSENVIGGVRQVELTKVGELDAEASILAPGRLAFDLDPGTSGTLLLTYNANGAGLNANLKDGGASFFAIKVSFVDLKDDADLVVGLKNTLGAESTTSSAPITGLGTVIFPFSSFGSIDFSTVNEITLSIVAGNDVDIALDGFYTGVPEPSTFFAFGVGLAIWFGTARLRKRRTKSNA